MITETIFVGRDNTFSLRLLRGGAPLPTAQITAIELHAEGMAAITDPSAFVKKPDGIIEVHLAPPVSGWPEGSYRAYFVTFDALNPNGIRWPDFKLKVKP